MIYEGDISVTILVLDQWGEPAAGLDKDSLPAIKVSPAVGDDITDNLVDLAAVDSEHTDWGVIGRGDGLYRLDLPELPDGAYDIHGSSCGYRVVTQRIQVGLALLSTEIPNKIANDVVNKFGAGRPRIL